jgi:hypothetical protein
MHITEVIWWAYTGVIAAIALFMIVFSLKVREKGD